MHLILFVIAVLIQATISKKINENEGVSGVLIKRTFRRASHVVNMTVCPYNAMGHICAEDCKTLMACQTGSDIPMHLMSCVDMQPSTPYCIPGETRCTDIADYNNDHCIAAQTSTFTCTNIGYFPDPSDTSLYHICSTIIQETYQCPPQYVFDATKTKCKLKHFFKNSCAIDCSKSINQYIPHPCHKSYYAFCSNEEIIMYKCDDINHFEFNPKSMNCEFVCKSAGWFPNYKDCHQYYECYKNKKKHNRGFKWFNSRILTCPTHFKFDAKRRQCVEGHCSMPTSKTPTPPTTKPTTTPTTPSPPPSPLPSSTPSPPPLLSSSTSPVTSPGTPTTTKPTTTPTTPSPPPSPLPSSTPSPPPLLSSSTSPVTSPGTPTPTKPTTTPGTPIKMQLLKRPHH